MNNSEVIWVETYTGKHVDPLHLQDSDICIEDIAHSLSLICRFVGHCRRFYSVAQHSIHTAELIEDCIPSDDVGHRTMLAGLLHDAAEAYINDISRPIKYAVKGFKEIDNVATGVVMKHFNCVGTDWTLIKKMDNMMLATEASQLMYTGGEDWYLPEPEVRMIIPVMIPQLAEDIFKERFYRYGGR